MANGIVKNWEVVKDELSVWWNRMPIHWLAFKSAKGIAEKAHKAVNLVTESVRLLPRTLTYSLLIFVVLDGIMHVWLWVR